MQRTAASGLMLIAHERAKDRKKSCSLSKICKDREHGRYSVNLPSVVQAWQDILLSTGTGCMELGFPGTVSLDDPTVSNVFSRCPTTYILVHSFVDQIMDIQIALDKWLAIE